MDGRCAPGDRVTLYNEKTGRMVGRTTIKEVVTQSGADNHIIVEDPLPRNNVNVSIAVDSVSQPGSIIRNCTVNGTLRFRSPVTVEDSTLNLMYAWIDNLPNIEGPVPRDIHFKNCRITKVQAPLAVDSYVSPDRIMVIGSYCTDGGCRNTSVQISRLRIVRSIIMPSPSTEAAR